MRRLSLLNAPLRAARGPGQLDAAPEGPLADGVGDGVGDGAGAGLVVLGVGTVPSLGPAGFLSQAARPPAANAATTIHDKVFFMLIPSR